MRNLHLGTIGWSYNFWKGTFYPNTTASKDYLAYYGKRFDTVEVDSTFYHMPTQHTVANWKQQTPEAFVFSLKFPQSITHVKMLRDSQNETAAFLNKATLLGEKLGPLLLQFPPNFDIKHLSNLADFLQKLPRPYRYVVEVRNKTLLTKDFYTLLEANKVALAMTDSPQMLHINEVTSDFLYIRWEGDRKRVKGTLGKIEADKKSDLKTWVEQIKPFLEQKTPIFGYFGKYYSGYPPSDIAYVQGLTNIN